MFPLNINVFMLLQMHIESRCTQQTSISAMFCPVYALSINRIFNNVKIE